MDYKSTLAIKSSWWLFNTIINPPNINFDFFDTDNFKYLYCKENKIKNKFS